MTDQLMAELFPDLFGSHRSPNVEIPDELYDQTIAGQFKGKDGWDGTDDFDIHTIMEQSVDPLTGTLRDLKLDDRDLPLAKNFFEFSTQFSTANPPWARQMVLATVLLAEFCPLCSNKDWLDLDKVPVDYPTPALRDHIVFLNYGRCPKCGARKSDLVKTKAMKLYKELVLVWGQRSGKSMTGMFVAGYQLHRFIKYPKISTVYREGIQDFTPLTATFVSLTFTKAISLMWSPFMNIINTVPWFQEYHKLLDHYGQRYGTEFYRKKDLFIKYFHKNLHVYPSHPNSAVLRGDTRFMAGIDELGLFAPPKRGDDQDETSERANADEAHASLDNSLATVNTATTTLLRRGYDHTPPALLLGLSSPKSERDKVMRLLRQSQAPDASQYMLGSQLATWEINPNLPRDSDYIKAKFANNPIHAMRDFGAQPPRVASPFIHERTFTGKRNPFIGERNKIKMEYDYSAMDELFGVLRNANEGKLREPSVMSIDAGLVDNSFCLASTHIDPKTGKTVVPAIVEIMPHDGRTINFNKVYKHLILPFARATNAQLILADRWNSIDLLHRAKEDIQGLEGRQYSPNRKDANFFRQMLENGNLLLPYMDVKDQEYILKHGVENFRSEMLNRAVEHLFLQFLTMQDIGDRAMPEKGDGYTDDMFRAILLGVSKIHEPRVIKLLKEAPVKYKDDSKPSVVGIYVSRR